MKTVLRISIFTLLAYQNLVCQQTNQFREKTFLRWNATNNEYWTRDGQELQILTKTPQGTFVRNGASVNKDDGGTLCCDDSIIHFTIEIDDQVATNVRLK